MVLLITKSHTDEAVWAQMASRVCIAAKEY